MKIRENNVRDHTAQWTILQKITLPHCCHISPAERENMIQMYHILKSKARTEPLSLLRGKIVSLDTARGDVKA